MTFHSDMKMTTIHQANTLVEKLQDIRNVGPYENRSDPDFDTFVPAQPDCISEISIRINRGGGGHSNETITVVLPGDSAHRIKRIIAEEFDKLLEAQIDELTNLKDTP